MSRAVKGLLAPFLMAALIFLITFCKKDKNKASEKSNVSTDLIGTWKNRAVINATKNVGLTIVESGTSAYARQVLSGSGASENKNASGTARLEGNTLSIGVMDLSVQSFPTEVSAGNSRTNTYIVIEHDTLYKQPYFQPVSPQFLCSDGTMNGGETGIDCGGSCEPCATTSCNTPLGFGENAYLANQRDSLYGTLSDTAFSNPIGLVLYFKGNSNCNSYKTHFFGKGFLNMPVNTTQLFTIDDSQGANSCTVEIDMYNETLHANASQKVYIRRISATTFNIKFCNLLAETVEPYTLNTSFSANVNFTF